MNYSDEIPLCRFGTPLEPLEEDDVPKKKIAIEDQIVTDENGRRRFHGAFTGGFSAGFWNTVGSLEGWKPKSFKSSRTEKAETQRCQLPKDFMDDEDLGEFGIAPQRVQAKEDFAKNDSNNRKRIASHVNKPADTLGPVLQEMLESPREKVAVRLLMHMGWKPGQGVGARQTMKEKTLANKRNSRELYVLKMYGCEMETNKNATITNSEESADFGEDEEDFEITFAPDDFEPFVCSSKDNVFGLGYSGLGGQISAKTNSHINLFGPLEVLGKDNKKLSIRGQAFGVGALEEEDEDIYAKDDMSQYDFCLNDKKKVDKKKIVKQDQCVIEGFAADSQTKQAKTVFTIPLDANFQPKNWLQRKTRFDKLSETEMLRIMHNDAHKKKGIARHDIGPDERGNILCSETVKVNNERTIHMEQINKTNKSLEAKDFVSSSKLKELKATNQEVEFSTLNESLNAGKEKVTEDLTKAMSSNGETFKPFAPNAEKQERYEKFIAANLKNEEDIQRFLKTIQPIHLSEWDREMERKEFIQAKSIYKPLNGLMSERFVSKTFLSDSMDLPATKVDNPCEKKIINVQRIKIAWKPCSLIYKRFNIPETFSGAMTESKPTKKGKFSIFDYIENSVNSKKDFITPVIIPKHIEKPLEVQRHTDVDLNKKVILEKIVTIPNIETSNSESASNTVQKSARKSKSPKTELELKIEACKHKHPSEKKDLFKSIFDSSSESDSDSNVQNDSKPEAGTEISSEIVDKLIKPSTSRNILKNNSPPRGIFASLFSSSASKVEAQPISNTENQNVEKILFKPVHQRESTNLLESEDMYGPKLPQNISVIGSKTSKEKDIDRKIMELLSTKSSEKKIIEKWVEKKHSSKNKKKHKRKDLDTTETKHRKLKKKKKSRKKD